MEDNKLKNAKILIIDDDVNLIDMLTIILNKYGHTVVAFTEPVSAIEALKNEKYDILLVNYLMTPVNGEKIVELIRQYDKEMYIILMSIHRDLAPSIQIMQNLDIQAYFEKSSHFEQLIILIQSGIKYIEKVKTAKSMKTKLEEYLLDFAKILLNTIGAKDHYTEGHSIRVSKYATCFAEFLGISQNQIDDLKTASYFHDIGKIGIPDNILTKQGKLEDSEYETIKLHPIIGANILGVSNIFNSVKPIILYHHERIDGKGYPEKLNGDQIPYLAKILSICDSFDAITAKRSYKPPNSVEHALNELDKGRGTQFDEELVNKFIEFVNNNEEKIKDVMTIT